MTAASPPAYDSGSSTKEEWKSQVTEPSESIEHEDTSAMQTPEHDTDIDAPSFTHHEINGKPFRPAASPTATRQPIPAPPAPMHSAVDKEVIQSVTHLKDQVALGAHGITMNNPNYNIVNMTYRSEQLESSTNSFLPPARVSNVGESIPMASPFSSEVSTPTQYQKHISLRGKLNLRQHFLDNEETNSLFKIDSSDLIIEGTEIGSWEGFWGMNDSAFSASDGVLSPFHYSVKKFLDSNNEFDEAEVEEFGVSTPLNNNTKVKLSGYFKIRSPVAPDKINPFIQIAESDVTLEFYVPEGSTQAKVVGSGTNSYGFFKLFGEYDTQSSELHCYREYTKQPKSKGKAPKRKSSVGPKPSTLKRPRPGSLPPTFHAPEATFGFSTPQGPPAPPPGPPLSGLANPDIVSAAELPKRQTKTPMHLQESLNPKTLEPIGQKQDIETVPGDWAAMKQMLDKLIEGDKERWFTQPVDPIRLGLVSYFDVVKYPMDLGTILAKYNRHEYMNYLEMARDIRLVFSNAKLFNPPKHPVHTVANMHLKLFEKDIRQFERDREKLQKSIAKEAKEEAKVKAKQEKLLKKETDSVVSKTKSLKKKEKELLQSQAVASRKHSISGSESGKSVKKSKQKLMSMFSSSDDDDDNSDGDSDESDALAKQLVEKKIEKKKNKVKRKPKSDDVVKKTVDILDKQMEMMKQMEEAYLNKINKLNQELQTLKTHPVPMQVPQQYMQPQQGYMGQVPQQQQYQQPQMMPQYAMPLPGMQQGPPTLDGKEKKSRAKVRPITYQQKKELGQNMNQLPPEALPDMIKLLQEEGADLGDGEEVELEIDKLNDKVLRKLIAFVNKTLNKAKRNVPVVDMQFDDTDLA